MADRVRINPVPDDRVDRILTDPVGHFAEARERIRAEVRAEVRAERT